MRPTNPIRCAAVALLALAACAPRPLVAPAASEETRLNDDVQVRRIAPGLWMHVTWATIAGGARYPANGMLLETEDGSVLFDTGWNDEQARALLAWAERDLRRPVRRAYVTHAHDDRTGGIAALRRAGVPVAGLERTAEIARAEGLPAPDGVPGLAAAPVRESGYELFYPGPGHAPDNIVAWFPAQRVIFGGCLVKADTATTVGNVADADVPNWPRAVASVRQRYPAVRLVIPGHGAPSGPAALPVTEALIATKGPAALDALRRARP
ncbi:MAG TPA: subclass B1 metallo-beta-lactamase [Longimicrobium sp.]|nr:subclass B1 metallo-beta-lactamase [Longimicrobium sp.]